MWDDGDEAEVNVLAVNKGFAKSFDERESKRLLEKETALGLRDSDDDDDSDDESEDDDARELTRDLDLKIVKTINAIRRKDPAIYSKDAKFFDDVKADEDATTAAADAARPPQNGVFAREH